MGAAGGNEALRLRPATEADLDFICATERLPGFELLTAQWPRDVHAAALSRNDTRYLVGGPGDAGLEAFAILQPLNDVHEGAKLKRICVAHPGRGFGRQFLAAVIDWVFAATDADRLWLDVFAHNARARHVYRRVGLREDGLLRQAYRMPDGTRADRHIMSVLRSEWRAR